MGRAIRGMNSIACRTTGRPDIDVERLRGEALKMYLEHRLRELDEQIADLSSACERNPTSEPGSTRPSALTQENHWELLLDLSYLCAARDALVSTLNAL